MDEQQTLRKLLRQVCAEEAELLADMGMEPNFRNAVLLGQVKKAAKGDAAAFRCLRELLGEGDGPVTELSGLSDRALLAMLEEPDG